MLGVVPEATINGEEVPKIHRLNFVSKWRSCSSSRHWLSAQTGREYGRAIPLEPWRIGQSARCSGGEPASERKRLLLAPHSVCPVSGSKERPVRRAFVALRSTPSVPLPPAQTVEEWVGIPCCIDCLLGAFQQRLVPGPNGHSSSREQTRLANSALPEHVLKP
jgi:hypothetical protein